MAGVGSKMGGKRPIWCAKSLGYDTGFPKSGNQREQRGRDIDLWNPGKSRKK